MKNVTENILNLINSVNLIKQSNYWVLKNGPWMMEQVLLLVPGSENVPGTSVSPVITWVID